MTRRLSTPLRVERQRGDDGGVIGERLTELEIAALPRAAFGFAVRWINVPRQLPAAAL